MKRAILCRFKCINEFKVIWLFTTANKKIQYFKWLQIGILFASGFDKKNGEVNFINKRAMKVSLSCIAINCECWKGIIHVFLVRFHFAFYVASAILMLELLGMQCFSNLTCS